MSSLKVKDEHGIALKFGSKMTPSLDMEKLTKKRKGKGHFVNGEFEFDVIQISPKGFKTKIKTSYNPYELSWEDHEMLADVFEKLSDSHRKSSKRV